MAQKTPSETGVEIRTYCRLKLEGLLLLGEIIGMETIGYSVR